MKINKGLHKQSQLTVCVALSLLILFTIVQTHFSFGQNNPRNEIGNLKQQLNSTKDAEKVRVMLSLWYDYFSISNDTSLLYAQDALKLSLKLKNDTLIGRSYYNLGTSFMASGDDKKAKTAIINAVAIFQKDKDSVHLANAYCTIAQYYTTQSDNTHSLDFYYKALVIYFKLNKVESYDNAILVLNAISSIYLDKKDYKNALAFLNYALKFVEGKKENDYLLSSLYSSIANVYLDWTHYQKALEYFTKAYQIDKTIENPSYLAYTMDDLGTTYYYMKKPDSAYYFFYQAIKIFKNINNDKGIYYAYQYLGNIYRDKKDYTMAMTYYKKVLANSENNNEESRISSILYEIGKAYYNMKLFTEAKANSYRSLSIAKNIEYKEYVYNNYLLLSDIYSEQDSCDISFKYYKLYNNSKDSIYNADIHGQIADIQGKYEADKREKAIKILKQNEEIQNINLRKQRIIKNSLFIVVSLLIVLAFFIFRSYRIKRRSNIVIAAEKDKSDKLLMNILPEETAEELKREGFAKTRFYEHVSILFTDFKGFTLIAEKLSPEELVAELDYCFKAFDDIIGKYPIEKIKTIGDSYMCAGGLPVPNTSNPKDIVNCALDICHFMLQYKEERQKRNEPFFEIRIGVHTGSVVSGIVGTKKFAYDIWGDAVNVAARMESSGAPGSVNISGETYEFVKNDFICNYRGKIEAKNKGLVDMYFVECCKV